MINIQFIDIEKEYPKSLCKFFFGTINDFTEEYDKNDIELEMMFKSFDDIYNYCLYMTNEITCEIKTSGKYLNCFLIEDGITKKNACEKFSGMGQLVLYVCCWKWTAFGYASRSQRRINSYLDVSKYELTFRMFEICS